MAKRQGLGTGKGSGWKNLISSDSYRHELSRRGIKTNQVSLSKTKKLRLKKEMMPLISKHIISGYNVVENPHIKKKDTYRVIYGHDVKKRHREIIIDKLEKMGVDYFVVPREAQFLSEEAFIKTPNQVKEGDIITNDKEYQIVIDVNKRELKDLTEWLEKKTVNRDEALILVDGTLNPTVSMIDLIPIPDSYTTPDIRIQNRKEYPDFKRADKIVKKLDKDTDLVILSVRSQNTKALRKALKGERQASVLIDDFKPDKHSLFKFIQKNTKIKR